MAEVVAVLRVVGAVRGSVPMIRAVVGIAIAVVTVGAVEMTVAVAVDIMLGVMEAVNESEVWGQFCG